MSKHFQEMVEQEKIESGKQLKNVQAELRLHMLQVILAFIKN